MTTFFFWTSVYNAGLALILTCPPFYQMPGLNIPTPLWGWRLAGFLAYTCVALLPALRDLRHRAAFVYWESIPSVFLNFLG